MLGMGTTEIVIILVIVLVLFGGRKIPELLRGVGKGVGELQKGLAESRQTLSKLDEDPEPTPVKRVDNPS